MINLRCNGDDLIMAQMKDGLFGASVWDLYDKFIALKITLIGFISLQAYPPGITLACFLPYNYNRCPALYIYRAYRPTTDRYSLILKFQ